MTSVTLVTSKTLLFVHNDASQHTFPWMYSCFAASMLPLHNKWNINLQVVWEEQTDALDTVGSFKDYFSGTPVPLGPWPSGHKGGDWSKFGCKLHWIAGFTFAQAFADGWWEK